MQLPGTAHCWHAMATTAFTIPHCRSGRDPRFDELTGTLDQDRFKSAYAFLYNEQLPEERQVKHMAAHRCCSMACQQLCTPGLGSSVQIGWQLSRQTQQQWQLSEAQQAARPEKRGGLCHLQVRHGTVWAASPGPAPSRAWQGTGDVVPSSLFCEHNACYHMRCTALRCAPDKPAALFRAAVSKTLRCRHLWLSS